MVTRQCMNCSMLFIITIWITNMVTAHSEDVVLTSTLADGHTAPPNEEIIFTCTTRHSSILQWSSSEYISSDGYNIQIYNDTLGTDVQRGSAHATLVRAAIENGVLVLVSELHIRASTLHPKATMECNNNGYGSSQTIRFALQNVTLTSTLTDGLVAYGEEEIVFTCTTRYSNTLEWSSSEYIDSNGYNIQVYNGTLGTDIRRGSAHATLVRAALENGVLVLVSELRIRTSTMHPTAIIECNNDGHGSSRTILFALQNVTLTSTLTDGLVAYGEEEIVFTCTTRYSNILQWSSSEYIDSDGYNIQIYNDTLGTNVRRGSAHATLVRATIESGVLVLVSELRIRASTLYSTATIECNDNGHGLNQTITFNSISKEPTTTSVGAESNVESGNNDNPQRNLPITAIVVPVVVVAAIAISIMLWTLTQCHKGRSNKVGSCIQFGDQTKNINQYKAGDSPHEENIQEHKSVPDSGSTSSSVVDSFMESPQGLMSMTRPGVGTVNSGEIV